jgi:prepilin-type N-terminal cleavage/methylation domain-containing protein
MKPYRAFTLIELTIVILILGILATVAVPKFVEFQENARKAKAEAVIGAVKEGIGIYMSESILNNGREPKWPETLDNAPNGYASSANPFFVNVLESGVVDSGWQKSIVNPVNKIEYYYLYYELVTPFMTMSKYIKMIYNPSTGNVDGPLFIMSR